MIVRKPYALLIKNFRFIHLILTLLIGYVLYAISPLSNLFNTAIKNQTVHYGRDLVGEFISPNIYLAIILIILISLLVLWLMIAKKKPYLVYLYNTIAYMMIFVLLWLTQQNLVTLANDLVDVIILGNFRDFLIISMVVQTISFGLSFVRSTGFDIKKFNFNDDLEELDINAEDREEVELQLEFDWDKYVAKLKRRGRYIKYFYVENRFVSNLVLVILIAAISVYTYALTNLLNRSFSEKDIIVMGTIDAIVNDSYVTKKDYRNNAFIKENKIVVVNVSLRSKNENILDSRTTYLVVGDSRYTPLRDYDKYIEDLGTSYNLEKLPSEYKDYLLVYKVANSVDLSNAKIVFNDYIFDGSKNFSKQMKVSLKIENLDKKDIINNYNINEEMKIEDLTFIKDMSFNVKETYLSDSVEIPYRYCLNTDSCFDSVEVLRPILNSHEKTILTIKGDFDFNFSDFVTKYGLIEYDNDGVKKTRSINKLLPKKSKKAGIYYFEVPKDVNKINKLIFTIRNHTYEYSM